MNDDELFNESNIPQSNWFSFTNVGDKIAGEVVEIFDQPEKDGFGARRVFVLKQPDGTDVKVGIDLRKEYVITRASKAEVGDILGFRFEKEIPPAVKGHHPAKSIQVFVKKP
jgi:hypothetical protein